jgi:hypothetical protein
MQDNEQLNAAVAALQKARGSYLNRNAETIAKAAVDAPDLEAAARAVDRVVGHTTTGERNAAKWAKMARKAAGLG